MTRKELRKQIARATRYVDAQPAWKQNILVQSSQATISSPRQHIDNRHARIDTSLTEDRVEKHWPTVSGDDPGIRPACDPDQCFYCEAKVGQKHRRDCEIVRKRVRVQYTFTLEVDIPHNWDAEMFEFHRNDSTWCADNALDDIEEFKEKKGASCLCAMMQAKFLEVVDDTPRLF